MNRNPIGPGTVATRPFQAEAYQPSQVPADRVPLALPVLAGRSWDPRAPRRFDEAPASALAKSVAHGQAVPNGDARELRTRHGRRGFTLIEMLVSLTITLIMMGAVVTLFQVMADSVSASRALIELSDRMRNCRNRLQTDLIGATAKMNPPMRPEDDAGYFEIIEGPANDADYTGYDGTGKSQGVGQQRLAVRRRRRRDHVHGPQPRRAVRRQIQ